MQQLEATSQRETVRYVIEVLKDPLSDPRDSMPKPALRTDVPRMADLTIGRIVEGVVTNVTTFGIFLDIGMKQTGFVHKSEVSNNASDTPASVANVGDVLRARVTSLDFQRDRIVLSLRNVPAEGESVPDTMEQNEQSSNNDNNTNVMPSTTSQSTPNAEVPHDERTDESQEVHPDESVDMNDEPAEYGEQGVEHEHEEHVYEEMQGEGEEYQQDNEDYAHEMQDEGQYGEEFVPDEGDAAQQEQVEEMHGEDVQGEEQYGEEYDNNNNTDVDEENNGQQ